MFDKPFSVLFGVGLFLWIGSILLESTPQSRLHASCAPVRWSGNLMGSLAALSDSPKFIEKVAVGTDEFDYGCQFTLWRLMYGKAYVDQQKSITPNAQQSSDDVVLPPGGIMGTIPEEDQNTSASQKKVKLIQKPQPDQ